MSTKAFFTCCALAVMIICMALAMAYGHEKQPAIEPTTGVWKFIDPPMGKPLVGLWERHEEPGYYDSYTVIRFGDEWLAYLPDGEPTISIQSKPPVCWVGLP